MFHGSYQTYPYCEVCGYDNAPHEMWQDAYMSKMFELEDAGLDTERINKELEAWTTANPSPSSCGHCGSCGCCPCNREDCTWCNEEEDPRDILRREYETALAEGRATEAIKD